MFRSVTTIVLAIIVSAALLPFAAQAETEGDMIEMLRSQIKMDRRAVVAENMDLPENQAEEFWAVYEKYHADRDEIADRRLNLLTEFYENQIGMTAELAHDMLYEALDLEDDLNDRKHNYVSEFEKVLGPRHTLRYYQIENKLDAMVNYELARVVPLRQ